MSSSGFQLQFDVVSYTLIALVIALIVLPVVLAKDPDIHPFALLKQSSVAPVRNPKESAVYRSQQTPPGYPLVSGLGLPAAQKYSTRSGDIRDIWKLAIEKGKGKILVVKGRSIEENDINGLTKEIHALGAHWRSIGAKRVALHLPNDTENLVASFACAFYNLVLIILPFDPAGTTDEFNTLLKRASADVLVTQGGQLSLDEFLGAGLKEIVLVIEKASQHLGWGETSGVTKRVQYDEIVKETVEPIADLDIDLDAPAVVIFGPKVLDEIDMVEFSHRNIIAGVATQTIVLPKAEKYTPDDVFVPVDTLSDLYTRIHTYVALSSGSTVVLNPIGGKHADIEKACKVAQPNIICTAPESLLEIRRTTRGGMYQLWHGFIYYCQSQTLRAGRIPGGNFFTRANDFVRPNVGPNLRLIFVAETGGDETCQALNSLDLSDLRVFFKSKVVYGLKHHKVAGPVTQCNVYDYRLQMPEQLPSEVKGIPRFCARFGPVSPGLEIKLRDCYGYSASDAEGPRGEVMVSGAPVAGGKETSLRFFGKWEEDGTLSYA